MMNSFTLPCCALLSLCILSLEISAQELVGQSPEGVKVQDVIKTITEDECYDHVQFLAHKDNMGRGTLTIGFDLAAEYVERHLKEYGLTPAGEDGSYRLPVDYSCITAGQDSLIAFDLNGVDIKEDVEGESGILNQYVPVIGSVESSARGEAVFAGYAIDSRNDRWRDLDPSKIKGKIVFAFSREPKADNEKTKKFEGAKATVHSSVATKAKAVADAGGLALVVVPDPNLVPQSNIPMPQMVPFVDPTGNQPVSMTRRLGMPDIPVMSVSRDLASLLFDTDVEAYFEKIEKRYRPSLLSSDKEISVSVSFERETVKGYNLGALVKGDGSSDKVLILGAHLDHVGFDHFMDRSKLQVRPGADDNASGSASLLEVAEALAPYKPKHDILFLWFSGEELGLLGSRSYCESPLYPHDKTIAMLNMDMIGRGENILNIGGLWKLPNWSKFINKQHKKIKSRIKMDNDQGRDLFARSDHYSFYQKDVTALFFFEADLNKNKVYHQPTDVAEEIQGKKMAQIAQLFSACVWALAYEDDIP